MVQPPQLGSLVFSLAGRDTGEHYFVVGLIDSKFVLVANGLSRPLQSPKKKNTRHVQVKSQHAGVADKLFLRRARDEDIVLAIREMVNSIHPGEEREGVKT